MSVTKVLFVLTTVLSIVLGETTPLKKRELPHYDFGTYDFDGHNSIDDSYSHYAHYVHLPAYSTVSYIMASGHKPVSYSGFTNHGNGHHDPGYAVHHRSDGFVHGGDHHHYDHYYL